MRCDEVQDMIPLFVGGDLARKVEIDVWAHVSSCPKCHEQVVKYQQAYHDLRGLAHPEIPPYLLDEMWELVKVRIAGKIGGGINETVCQRVTRLIPLVVGKDVPAKTREAVEAHTAECEGCGQLYEEYHESRNALKTLRNPEIPAHIEKNLWAGIKARIESEPVLIAIDADRGVAGADRGRAGRIVTLLSVSSKVATRAAAVAMVVVLGALFYNVAKDRGLLGGEVETTTSPETIAEDEVVPSGEVEVIPVTAPSEEAPFRLGEGSSNPERNFSGIFRLLEGVMEDIDQPNQSDSTEDQDSAEPAPRARPQAEQQFILPESAVPADETYPSDETGEAPARSF
ncbi:MAG: zf-HC2 domain-containing protein [Planctomycetes bacterium]|nr:zf-HC2 domain-containing protein [Planctomycetota bacterium]